jgi:hypothetical protein
MKWLFFVLSLLALFVANNALFWAPGRYDWFTFVAAGISISLAISFAWLSSKRFVGPSALQPTWKKVVMAPPSTICIFVLLLFLGVGVLKLIAYGNR